MAIGFKAFGYVPGRSAYGEMQAWRSKRQNIASSALSDGQALAGSINSAMSNLSSGNAQIIGQQAAARIQAEASAKLKKLSTIA